MPAVTGIYRSRDVWAAMRRPAELRDLVPQIIDNVRLVRRRRGSGTIGAVVRQLVDIGVAVLPDVVSDTFLRSAREDLDRFEAELPQLTGTTRIKPASTGGLREYEVHEWQAELGIHRTHDPLMVLPSYAQFLLLPELRAVADGYLGRRWLYQAMIATRTGPAAPHDRRGFAGWHHDARGRKLNAILVLTDVDADGSATIVMQRSHRLLYAQSRRERNFMTDHEVAQLRNQLGFDEFVASARAGSLVLFDSHALHRGRRSERQRDAYQVNLMTKPSHLWPQEISASLLGSLPHEAQRQLQSRSALTVVA